MDHLAVLKVSVFTLYTEMDYLGITVAYLAQCNILGTIFEQPRSDQLFSKRNYRDSKSN
jgi:hypothetical protein